jgi:hypothetical protein
MKMSIQHRKQETNELVKVWQTIAGTLLVALIALALFVIFGIVGRMDREFELAELGYNQQEINEILK